MVNMCNRKEILSFAKTEDVIELIAVDFICFFMQSHLIKEFELNLMDVCSFCSNQR